MTTPPSGPSGVRGPRDPALTAGLLAALCVVMTLNPIVANSYLPGLAIMAADLGTSIAGIQIALLAFFAGVAVGQLVVGALSDSLGRRRVLLAAFALLTVAGVLVAVAPTLELLVAGRVVQGLGASAGVVVVRAVVADVGRGPEVGRAYSILTGTLAAGPLLASFLGTVLLQAGGWRLILAAVAVASGGYLLLAVLGIPETLPRARRAPFRIDRMAASYGRLARDPVYVGNALTMAFLFAGIAVHVSAASFVAQDVLGADPWGFWLMFTAYALAVLAGGWLNAPFATRVGVRRALLVELALAIGATAGLVALAATGALGIPVYVALVVVAAAGVAGGMANATTLTLGRAASARGSGAALMGFVQFGIGALASPVGGLAGPSTALPMAIGMLTCFVLALVATGAAGRRERREPEAAPDPLAAP